MKKVSYAKLALSLILASSVLVGCGKGTNSVSAQIIPSSQPSPATVEKSPQLKVINTAFDELKTEQQKFLNTIEIWVYRDTESITSNKVSKKIENLQTKIQEYRQNQLPKLKEEERASIEKILDSIDNTLVKISQKVITPFKQGLTRDAIENVQKQLDFFGRREISPRYYGNFGKDTFEEITKFLQDKQKLLEYDIQKLNSLDSDRSLPKSIVDFKKEFLIVATLALLAIGIYWLKFRRKSNSNFFILKLLTNRQNPNNKWFNKFNLWTRNTHKDDQKKNTNNASKVNIQNVNKNQVEENNNNFHEKVSQELEDNDQTTTEEIRKLKKRIEDLESCLPETENVEVREQTEQTDVTPWQPSEPPASQTYQSTSPSVSSSSSFLIEVSPTEESLANREMGGNDPIVLKNKRRGIYGVYLDWKYHCLVPSQYFRINQRNYKSVEDLFECQNYDPNYSDSYTVIRPAVVYPLAGGKTWQLQQRGVLRF
ncbi:hypothetical protein [Microcystis sp. M061S2]|uniref:hypothetical protein n=1 Tax=Microcystis sp. M061S2 TaxID=2771171 RepID=UPI00258BCABF|nr:hypothetical protein [Microcystis sp. M061S2]